MDTAAKTAITAQQTVKLKDGQEVDAVQADFAEYSTFSEFLETVSFPTDKGSLRNLLGQFECTEESRELVSNFIETLPDNIENFMSVNEIHELLSGYIPFELEDTQAARTARVQRAEIELAAARAEAKEAEMKTDGEESPDHEGPE